MAQSLSCLYVHIIFHTKNNQNLITKTVEQELHAYIGGVIKKMILSQLKLMEQKTIFTF